MANEYKIPKELKEAITTGEKLGLFQIKGNKIEYVYQRKSYKISDPEEHVRALFYLELIKKYQYPKERIDLEVVVPRRKPEDKADIVIYEDRERKSPFLVVECKKDAISDAEYKQAIEQVFGNANSLRAKYAAVIAGATRTVFTVEGFKPLERDKNVIADIPIKYGKAPTYRFIKGDSEKEIMPVKQGELKRALEKCHDTVWQGGRLAPTTAFDEISKLLFCKLQDEKEGTKLGKPYAFQVGSHETAKEVFARIDNIYKEAKRKDEQVFKEDIKLESPIVYAVVEHLQSIAIGETDLDVKGAAFEYFMKEFFKGKMGQFFTPRDIINFVVEFLEPKHNEFILDPACGSGGFLLHAMDFVRKKSAKEYPKDEAYTIWHDFAMKNLFGIEVNDQIARVCKMNMIVHDDGHTNVIGTDALRNFDEIEKIHPSFKKEKFDIILTNPPFGATVKDTERPYLPEYELGSKIRTSRKNQKTEILFIERCIDYVRPGGRIGIVLPDGILTNSCLQYVRDFIMQKAQILGVVSLPQFAFSHYGAGVKASLLFLRKWEEGEDTQKDYNIFMSIAEHIGYDATNRPDKDEFSDILKAWKEFRKTNKIDFFVDAPLSFAVGRGEIEQRLDPFYLRNISYVKNFKTKYTLAPLGHLLKEKPQYGANEIAIDGDPEKDIRYIRITDIDQFGNLKKDDWKTAKNIDERYLLEENDILFARSGATAGKTFLYKKEFGKAIFAGYLIRFVINEEKVSPLFVYYYTQLKKYSTWVKSIQRPSGQPNINSEEFKAFDIPIPPRDLQNHIVKIMSSAHSQKNEKEAEAEKLLNSIDDYVLNELGIKLSQIKEKKSFSITFDKIKRKRFDPYSHQPKFERAYSALRLGKYELRSIGELIVDISGGATPKAKGDSYTGPEGIPFLRIQNVTPDGISFEDMNYINEQTHEGLLKRSQLKGGDVVFTITGRIGTVAVIPKEWVKGNINQHMVRLRFKDEILPDYFSAFFNTDFGNQQALRLTSGGSRIALDYKAIRSLNIPLPPLSVQQKIAQEVKSRREKAEKLKEEAKKTLAKTREKVEAMILGDNDK